MTLKILLFLLTAMTTFSTSYECRAQNNSLRSEISPESREQINATLQKLDHIKTAKTAILTELRNTLIIGRKAKRAIKIALNDRYPIIKDAMLNLVDYIVCSQEFITAISLVIKYQTTCICDELIPFDDITYTVDSAIKQKIDEALNKTFPELDEQTSYIFNVFYVTHANGYGCKALFNALEKQESILRSQLYQCIHQ